MIGQRTLDDLSTPLSEVTFVIVDLETTGGSPADDAITEIGAVKVRGGEVLGHFQTLVSPGRPVPATITALTGISNPMLVDAPAPSAAIPAFLEFAAGSVLVAHNAGFDVGFLQSNAARLHHHWPSFPVVDTVRLARAVLARDETRNVRLATLATHFRSPVAPTHRALDDARATVHVFHALLERTGTLGVHDLDDLLGLSRRVPQAVRRKAHLADGLPDRPGVYLFKDDAGRVLYVGTSRNVRARVRSYFTASEQRARMRQMVRLAASVTPIVCPTPLEAHVRELRLIAEHRPPYNRRSRAPERTAWLRLTDEVFPRLSVVRAPRGDDAAIGPFSGRRDAEAAATVIHAAIAVRQCRTRLTLMATGTPCVLAEIGRCGAPCDGTQDRESYDVVVALARAAMLGDPDPVVDAAEQRMRRLVQQERFEEAAVVRDQLTLFLRAAATSTRLRALAACPTIAAAAPSRITPRAWELVVIRHGRLVASDTVPHGPRLRPALDALVATAPVLEASGDGLPRAHVDEALAVLRWLEADGVRPAMVDGEWVFPVASAVGRLDPYRRARVAATQRSRSEEAEPSSMARAAVSRA